MRRQIDKIINEVTPWLLQLSLAAPFCSWGTLGKNGVFAATGMFRAHSNIMLFYYRVLKIWHQQLWAAENPRADLLLGKPDQISRCQPCRQLKVYFWLFVSMTSVPSITGTQRRVQLWGHKDKTWRPLQMMYQIQRILSREPRVICAPRKSIKAPTPPLRSPAHQRQS